MNIVTTELTELNKAEVDVKQVTWFVHGAMMAPENLHPGEVVSKQYLEITVNKVIKHVRDNAVIDGTYSDVQASIAQQAKEIFCK